MKRRITIGTVHCRCCGRELSTTSRSIHGLHRLKASYGYVCQNCSTPEEKNELAIAIGQGIIGKGRI